MRDAIRRFQRRNGLARDAVVKPDGETFQALVGALDFDPQSAETDAEDPDVGTEPNSRCRQIAVDLANGAGILEGLEQRFEGDRQRFENAAERLRNAEVADGQIATKITLGVISIFRNLASGNIVTAIAQAAALGGKYLGNEDELGNAAFDLNREAGLLEGSAAERDKNTSETAELEAERDRLGCDSITP